jgi:hypothetical protein
MAIDIEKEEIMSLAQAASRLPRRRHGKKTHVATLHRWAKNGLHNVVLETLQVGGTRCTSLPALQRFFERLAVKKPSPPLTTICSNPAVEAALDGEGL